mgnify:FL=1
MTIFFPPPFFLINHPLLLRQADWRMIKITWKCVNLFDHFPLIARFVLLFCSGVR